MALSGVGFVFLFFHTMQYTLFRNWPVWKEYGLFFIISAVSFLIIICLGFLKNAVDIGPSIEMSLWFLVMLGIILAMLGFDLLFKPGSDAGREVNESHLPREKSEHSNGDDDGRAAF